MMKRLVLLCSFLLTQPCRAHLPSASTLTLDDTSGTWSVPLAVLDDAWLVDADSDGKLSAPEWQVLETCVRQEMARSLFPAGTDKSAAVSGTSVTCDTTGPAPQVIVRFNLKGKWKAMPCRLLAKDDPLHRVTVLLAGAGKK